ncbi:MAG: diguanylate cyclase, partial [Bacilli bacterium]|nr:diguanylate cyclase [Bacilli bacterium]
MRYDMLLVGITFAIAIIALIISIIVFLRLRKIRGIWQIGALFVLEFIYSFGYALELATTDLEGKIFFNHVQYIAIPFIATTWVYVSHRFSNPSYVGKLKHYLWLLIIPVIVFVTVQLTYYTGIDVYYTTEYLEPITLLGSSTIEVLALGKGPLYYISSAYQTMLTAYVVCVYGKTYFKSQGIHRQQAFLLMIAAIVGTVASTMAFISPVTLGIDLTLYMLTGISYLIIYTMFKHEMLDLQPAAYKSTFENTINPLLILDDNYEVIAWNKAMENANTQIKVRYHIKIEDLFTNKDLIGAIKMGWAFSFKDKDKHFVMECRPLKGSNIHVSGYLVEFNEITAYVEKIDKLDYQATHDELTGILNRRAFFQKTREYLRERDKESGFACMMIDIDDFKNVNDTYGHLAGDKILAELSGVIGDELDENDLYARYGGEEFIVLLPNIEMSKAEKKAESIRIAVKNHSFKFEK